MRKWLTMLVMIVALEAKAQHASMGFGVYTSPKEFTVNLGGGIIFQNNFLVEGNIISPVSSSSATYFQARGGWQFVKKKLHIAVFGGYSLSIQSSKRVYSGFTGGTTIYYAVKDVFYKLELSINNKSNYSVSIGAMVPFSVNNKPQYRLPAFWLH